ncbi:MAG: DUF3301 domain-containing protein [Candidatus Methylophosphatis roskildensis]|uniref:DUF3301 domain-containing protein n=1 Tax=Candidatus Methylophosphatis roskildensis TaxID=2899263 RepID=A0A9D7HRQ5_9PROT|nr:DUF3301 domain-containing protein [Candidatus Methylophosphatis roskildensis]MBK7236042.1 DUF3301 domain-containing protein [Sterolibacteriaceae bacterium]
MPTLEIFGLIVLAGLLWLWFDSLKAREACMRESRAACAAEGLLLLDDTVAISTVRPTRDGEGRLRLQRVYAFEYSDTGNNRRKGAVTLIGDRVVTLYLEPWPT